MSKNVLATVKQDSKYATWISGSSPVWFPSGGSWQYQQHLTVGQNNALWGTAGQIVVSPYSGTHIKYKFMDAGARYEKPGVPYKGFAQCKGILPGWNTSILVPSVPSKLISESYNNTYNRFVDLADPQICFAEYVNEIISLKSIWLGTLGIFTSFIEKIIKLVVKREGDLGGLWVEFNFAVRPGLSDIKQISHRLNPQHDIVRSGSQCSTDQVYTQSYVPSTGFVNSPASGVWYGSSELSCHTTILGKTMFNVNNDHGLSLVNEILHFLMLNETGDIIQSLWNCVPFSWCIDYFFHIGDAITFLFPPSNVPSGTVVYSLRTKIKAETCVYWAPKWSNSGSIYYLNNSTAGSGKLEYTKLVRTISSTANEYGLLKPPPDMFEVTAGMRQLSYLAGILFSSHHR